jgi:hypothetical protein
MMYILNENHETVLEPNVIKWAKWIEKTNRIVARDTIGCVLVSTVFLGLDHNHFGSPPLLFETMIFGGPLDDSHWRYSTWYEALNGHGMAMARAVLAHATGPKS